ncbi:MAG: GAF domain-containing protein [Gemmatimonadota bacterium]|nr:GAF domain-containing protein [Gemmatimonadota bacterium]
MRALRRLGPVAFGIAVVAVATGLSVLLDAYTGATPFALLHLAVLVATVVAGAWAGWAAVAAAVLAAGLFLFGTPASLAQDPRMVGSLVLSAAVASAIVVLVDRMRRAVRESNRQRRTIERFNRLYDALSQINQAIVWSKSQEELFSRVCTVLVEHGGFQTAWIGLPDADTQRLVPVADAGDTEGYLTRIEVYVDERPAGQGPSGKAFRSGSPYVSNDMRRDASTALWRSEAIRSGFRSAAVFPIRRRDAVYGALTVYAGEREFFQEGEIALLDEAASDISFALDNFLREAERLAAEEEALRERLLVDQVFESVPGVIYLYDENGRFRRWNQRFMDVTGYSAAEMEAAHPLNFFRGDDVPVLTERIQGVFVTGEGSVEADFVSKDGTATPYFFTGRRVTLEGRPHLVGVGIDISERVIAEHALREAKAELERKVEERTADLRAAVEHAESADRIKSAFLATMSHELRTPLNSIIGFNGMVLKELAGPLNDEQKKQLGMALRSARHLLELINDVLDISKIEAGQLGVHREPVDLRASVEKVVGVIRPTAEGKGLGLNVELPDELPPLVGDRRRLEQVLLNLLNNAVKFTERGSVSLAVEAGGTTRMPDGRRAVRVQVRDTGIGIKPADLPTLFQPFRQLDTGLSRTHEGTGLGLAICRRLCELMGGAIDAESAWGRGSTFTVTLPVAPET